MSERKHLVSVQTLLNKSFIQIIPDEVNFSGNVKSKMETAMKTKRARDIQSILIVMLVLFCFFVMPKVMQAQEFSIKASSISAANLKVVT